MTAYQDEIINLQQKAGDLEQEISSRDDLIQDLEYQIETLSDIKELAE